MNTSLAEASARDLGKASYKPVIKTVIVRV